MSKLSSRQTSGNVNYYDISKNKVKPLIKHFEIVAIVKHVKNNDMK